MSNCSIIRYPLPLLVLSFLLAACSVGPDYVRPDVITPPAFKEAAAGWKQAQPADAVLAAKWWELFRDPDLNRLEEQVEISNQNIAQAAARYRQARALVAETSSALYPTLTVGASAVRSEGSAHAGSNKRGVKSDYLLPASFSWELDVWGRARRATESSQAGLQAGVADLAAVRLSVQAELASGYFQLRALDAQARLLDETIRYYAKTLELTNNRYSAGIAARLDVLQAETQLKSTRAQLIDLGVQRAQLEHAIALLIGSPAGAFSLSASPLSAPPPPIPLSLPSELLERRPDIASAERDMAAANARIGVARAAYYPTVRLGASLGLEAAEAARWLTWPSRFWSVGPALSETLFDGGLRKALNEQALAAYDGSVASYRQTVLSAFREVEDNLAALRILAEETEVQDEAVAAAVKTTQVTLNQYQAGVVGYLNVIAAQTAELANRRTAVGIQGRRMTAAVQLIKALGGGWDRSNFDR